MRYYSFLADGGTVIVESKDVASGTGPVSAGGVVAKSEQHFSDVMTQLDRVLPILKSQVQEKLADASEVKVDFGIKLAGKLGIVIASSNVEANFKISITWTK